MDCLRRAPTAHGIKARHDIGLCGFVIRREAEHTARCGGIAEAHVVVEQEGWRRLRFLEVIIGVHI
jgi:hypothetical protein